MNLVNLTLHDFRQFYGQHEINFSQDPYNVTVIMGENGNGKTGIFRAVNFCLFGERILEKDTQNNQSGAVHLVNFNKLQENVGEVVEALVTLEFTHNNKYYILTRSVGDRMNQKGKLETNLREEVTLHIRDIGESDGKLFQRPGEIKNLLNSVISTKVKDLFFFDGDKIEMLSTSSREARLEIKNGILKLLNIEVIDRLKAGLRIIIKDLRTQLKQSPNEQLKNAEIKKSTIEEQINQWQLELDGLNTLIEKNQEELNETNELLLSNKDIHELQKLLTQKQNELAKQVGIMEIQERTMRDFVATEAQHLNSLESLKFIYNAIVDLESKEGFDSGLTTEIIHKILESQKCMCGTHLDETNEFFSQLNDLLEKQKLLDVIAFFRDFKSRINSIIQKENEYFETIKTTLSNYHQLSHFNAEVEKDIEDIQLRISFLAKMDLDLEALEAKKESLSNKDRDILLNTGRLKENIKIKSKELDQINNQIESLMSLDRQMTQLLRKQKYYDQLYEIFDNVSDTYSKKMRDKLAIKTTEIFSSLISDKDRTLLQKVEISDTYELNAVGWNDVPLFKDISSGQKQILSLAFVTALANVASGEEEHHIDMPLFMDTPFAKLDAKNRANLLKYMPDLTSQWVLLVTNTEMTSFEANILMDKNKANDYYLIEKVSDGKSKFSSSKLNIDFN